MKTTTPRDAADSGTNAGKTVEKSSPRRTEANKDKTPARDRLILAALDEVKEVGFARLSLRRIAAACGVSCAAPYKHFRNKRELVEAVLNFIVRDWLRRQDAVLKRFEKESLRARLTELGAEFVRFMVENPQYRSVLMICDETFDSDYLAIKSGLSARSKELVKEYCRESGLSEEAGRIKMYVARSLIYGLALMFSNCELVYDESSMNFLRSLIDREFDLPLEEGQFDLAPRLDKRGTP